MLTPLNEESNELKNEDRKINLVDIIEVFLKQHENLK